METVKRIDDLTDSEWAACLGFDFENPIAKEFRAIVEGKLHISVNKDINLLFRHGNSMPEGGYDRGITDIIYTVPRRGSFPTTIREGATFKPPIFDIACLSELKMPKVVKRSPAFLRDIADNAADRMIREKESNMIHFLSSVAGEDGNALSRNEMNAINLTQGYTNFIQKRSRSPKYIIMSPVNAFNVLGSNNYLFHDSSVIRTDLIDDSTVLLCDSEVGNYISYPVRVSIHPAAKRMVSEVVCSMECAMFCRSERVHKVQVG